MGNSNFRPKICQVLPSQDLLEDQATSPRLITTVRHSPEQQQEIPEQRLINQLPPLKQRVPSIVHPVPDSQTPNAKSGPSIIKSHPPQKAKAWQPVALFIEPTLVSDGHLSKKNLGGVLEAQTLLTSQVTKKRRAHQKHYWEKQREQQRVYTSTVEGHDNERTEKIRLVSRPTQRDIFWDETNCQYLDLRELLQPSPPLTEQDFQMEQMMQQPQPDYKSRSNLGSLTSVTKFDGGHKSHTAQMTPQKHLPWHKDFRRQEKSHPNSLDTLEGQWRHTQWSVTTMGSCKKGERDIDVSAYDQFNSVHQQWNNWEKLHTD